MRTKNREWEANQIKTTLAVFLASYNQGIPGGFPHASAEVLHEFRIAHPALFKKGEGWSIDRHRKKLMDWLSSRQSRVV